MPPGRPRLDPDIKHQRLLLRRKRYQEANVEKRREAARVGMQKHRDAIAASDLKTKSQYRQMVSNHSESYRWRKAQQEHNEQRAQHATQKQVRQDEKAALQKKHQSMAQRVPPLTTAPKPLGIPLRRREDFHPAAPTKLLANPSRRHKDFRAASPMTPTPAPRGPRHAGVTHDLTMSSPPPYHAQICWPVRALSFDYFHDRPKNAGPFYAIVCKDFRGVVASKERRAEFQDLYPEARTWAAPDWPTFMEQWTLDCREYHQHDACDFTPPPSPTPPSSPSSLNPTPLPSPSPSPSPARAPSPPAQLATKTTFLRRCAAHSMCTRIATPANSPKHRQIGITCAILNSAGVPKKPSTPQASPRKPSTLTKDDLAHLASFRNATFSPRRLEQQFLWVLGPASVMQPLPRELAPLPPKITPILPAQAATRPRERTLAREIAPAPAASPSRPREESVAMPTLDRAVTAFKETPGADLLVTRDEDEAFEFIAEAN
ncbi:hypothetical protein B0H12DRAFT_1076657 [Mycena haematopus]|nr:hypothetical protein B0H12DRAFT_1076657 [Mycena haematopus]